VLVAGLAGGSGSTIGPDGALYVPETTAGRISRVDLRSGRVSTFASGLPKQVIPLGGVMDVEFVGRTAYALVTLVGPDVGGKDTVGIYRIDGPTSFTVVADIGAYAVAHPPATPFEVPSGVQYAMERFRGGFLVTDGHHNRVYDVRRNGTVTEVIAFGDIVPTGLAVRRHTVFLAEAGPVPHLPQDGKIVAFRPGASTATEVASGGRLLVDVETAGRCSRALYALAQGVFTPGGMPGSPANPDTGQLLRVNRNGTFSVVASGLDRPTSLEIVGTTAYVVTLDGEVWKITHAVDRRDGRGRDDHHRDGHDHWDD
jgi:hypothetical protein